MNRLIHGGDVYRNKNVTDFSSNCNPFGLPEGVKKAVCESIDSFARYPDPLCSELRTALANNLYIPEHWIYFGNGAADVIFNVCMASKPGKALLISPTFAEYARGLEAAGCEYTYYELNQQNEFVPQEDILDRLTEDIDMFFFCNPNNPTGVIAEKQLMTKILKKCMQNDIMFVVDECFLDFVMPQERREELSMKNKLAENGRLVILKAFTKLYAMAGLRLGYCLCSDIDFMQSLHDITQPWNVSIPAQVAGIAALKEKEYVEKSLAYLYKEKKYLKENLENAGFKIWGSCANYIFFKADKNFYKKCLERGFLVRDCSNYPGLSEGYCRIAVKLHEENKRFIDAVKEMAV